MAAGSCDGLLLLGHRSLNSSSSTFLRLVSFCAFVFCAPNDAPAQALVAQLQLDLAAGGAAIVETLAAAQFAVPVLSPAFKAAADDPASALHATVTAVFAFAASRVLPLLAAGTFGGATPAAVGVGGAKRSLLEFLIRDFTDKYTPPSTCMHTRRRALPSLSGCWQLCMKSTSSVLRSSGVAAGPAGLPRRTGVACAAVVEGSPSAPQDALLSVEIAE
eukprot:TRINITY_DN1991_c0_g1_i16.p2 TRINITY_DN1991_c0_g1~~TRINITY_DN1991_c0_g1_i16.p2  ORF type:complete len:218 (+),score=48.17 TRINITY_DN1991_c0_g1_i16:153-806(+)